MVVSPYDRLCDHADYAVRLPDPLGWQVATAVLPLPWLALRAALSRGNNPDRPRNLAKSVTVR